MRNVNKELEFDYLHKMSEACEMAKQLNIPVSFVAMKGADNSMTINVIENSSNTMGKEKVMKRLGLRSSSRMRLLLKNSSGGVDLNNMNSMNDLSSNKNQKEIISSYSLNRINKAQRQEELKNVLKETMSLTAKLKDQLKILEKNGVCGSNMK